MSKNPKRRIVIVDDDEDLQFILTGWLKGRYEVINLISGEDMLAELAFLEPDLVILDVMLPDANGFSLCRSIRSDRRFIGLPVLFLTGLNSNDDFIKNLKAGGSAYLTKPVERAQLLSSIQGLLMEASLR